MADIEFERPEAIKAYQEGLLAEALRYLAAHSKYYRRMFASYRIDIAKIRTLEDLVKIPFTDHRHILLPGMPRKTVPGHGIVHRLAQVVKRIQERSVQVEKNQSVFHGY